MGAWENGPFLATCGGAPETSQNDRLAQKAKNSKMEVVPALINSVYGRLRKRTIFGNLWGGPHELASKKAKMTELSTFSSISSCRTLRFAPWRAAFP